MSEQAYVLYMIFTQNLAIGHLNSPKICAAAEKLRCIENYFAIRLWLPETKSNQILRIPTPTPKLARSPPYLSLPISSSHFFLFSCSISISLSLCHPKSPTWKWRECMRWCSVCDWVWNERYIDWALRLPDCLPSDCFILSVKWRCRAQIILLWLHGCFCSIHWSSQVKGILHSTKI